MMRVISAPAAILILAATTSAAFADEQAGSWSTTTGSTNGVSTGVGNAGSFGIGSGTADSNATSNGIASATATSDGVHEANTYSLADNSADTTIVSSQDLQQSTVGNQITYNAGADPTNSPLPTGSNAVSGNSFSNFSGVLANGWNAGPASNVVATNNISANGDLAQR